MAFQITDEQLLGEMRWLADELEKPPTQAEMTEHGAFGSATYCRRFEPFVTVLLALGCLLAGWELVVGVATRD